MGQIQNEFFTFVPLALSQLMMKKPVRQLLPLICILTLSLLLWMEGCTDQTGQEGKRRPKKIIPSITISGSLELYPLLSQLAFEFNRIYPDVRIDVTPGSSLHGKSDILFQMMDRRRISNNMKESQPDTGLMSLPLAFDAILPFGNVENPYLKKLKISGITQSQFRYIYIDATLSHWGQLTKTDSSYRIFSFTRTDICEAGEIWSSFLGTEQTNLTGTGVYGEPGMIMAVRKNIYGLGYASIRYIYDRKTFEPTNDLAVIPIDLDNNGKIDRTENCLNNLEDITFAIRHGNYPFPPTRTLYLTFNKTPVNQLVVDYLVWIYENGMQTIQDAGYIIPGETTLKNQLQIIQKL
ncbi:MAG: substrate-binding domain-containing protein [Bacteroidales bacterium]|nr:substrate-binding domain-containing protein [Bacteroidales bacterium]